MSTSTGGSTRGSTWGDAFAGTAHLIRFVLRRDRVRIPVWLLIIAGTVVGTAASFDELFQDDAEIAARHALMEGNPAAVILTGPGYGLAEASMDNLGPVIVNELSATTLILVALMSIFLVVRHTRAEEESGRVELVRAGVVGRHASITATLTVVGGINLALGALLTLGMVAVDLSWEGSLAFGASTAGLGLVVTALAMLAAQVTEYSRAAIGLAFAVFGITFAVRAAGDITDTDLNLYSPVGWAQATRPFAGEEWWPLLLLLGLAVPLAIGSYVLNAWRDVGAGLMRARPGPARARTRLASPFGLAFRQQRASLLAWSAGALALGLLGAVLSGEAESLAEVDIYEEFMDFEAGALDDAVFSFYVLFVALVLGGYTVQTILRARGEESAGRAEPVLATAVSRWRWLGAHVLTTLVGTTVLLVIAGLSIGGVHAAISEEPEEVLRLLGALIVHLPALAVLVGLATALFGLVPRLSSLVWAVLGYCFFVWMFGPLLELPEWMEDVVPFLHTPEVLLEDMDWAPVLSMTGLALVLVAVGLAAFRRRDLATA